MNTNGSGRGSPTSSVSSSVSIGTQTDADVVGEESPQTGAHKGHTVSPQPAPGKGVGIGEGVDGTPLSSRVSTPVPPSPNNTSGYNTQEASSDSDDNIWLVQPDEDGSFKKYWTNVYDRNSKDSDERTAVETPPFSDSGAVDSNDEEVVPDYLEADDPDYLLEEPAAPKGFFATAWSKIGSALGYVVKVIKLPGKAYDYFTSGATSLFSRKMGEKVDSGMPESQASEAAARDVASSIAANPSIVIDELESIGNADEAQVLREALSIDTDENLVALVNQVVPDEMEDDVIIQDAVASRFPALAGLTYDECCFLVQASFVASGLIDAEVIEHNGRVSFIPLEGDESLFSLDKFAGALEILKSGSTDEALEIIKSCPKFEGANFNRYFLVDEEDIGLESVRMFDEPKGFSTKKARLPSGTVPFDTSHETVRAFSRLETQVMDSLDALPGDVKDRQILADAVMVQLGAARYKSTSVKDGTGYVSVRSFEELSDDVEAFVASMKALREDEEASVDDVVELLLEEEQFNMVDLGSVWAERKLDLMKMEFLSKLNSVKGPLGNMEKMAEAAMVYCGAAEYSGASVNDGITYKGYPDFSEVANDLDALLDEDFVKDIRDMAEILCGDPRMKKAGLDKWWAFTKNLPKDLERGQKVLSNPDLFEAMAEFTESEVERNRDSKAIADGVEAELEALEANQKAAENKKEEQRARLDERVEQAYIKASKKKEKAKEKERAQMRSLAGKQLAQLVKEGYARRADQAKQSEKFQEDLKQSREAYNKAQAEMRAEKQPAEVKPVSEEDRKKND